jgi:hypothetical protein
MIRKIITTMFSLSALVLGSIALAPPAHAATGVSYCFNYPGRGGAASGIPTHVQVNPTDDNVNGWTTVASDTANINGCGVYTLSGSYATDMYVRVIAFKPVYHGTTVMYGWLGISALKGTPGGGFVDLGYATVYCYSVAAKCNPADELPAP